MMALVGIAAAVACSRGQPPGGAPPPPPDGPGATAPSPRPEPPPAPTVVLLTDGRSEVRVRVEIARTPEERARGLMWRQHLAPDAGMLFLFDADEIHTFWMKNTLIPLDMIFIRSDLTVAGVVENAEPKTLSSRHIDEPSRHVLEVNGGFAAAHGIRAGTRVRFENIPEVPR